MGIAWAPRSLRAPRPALPGCERRAKHSVCIQVLSVVWSGMALGVLVKLLVVTCAALSASAGALYGSLPGVGDAPARVAAELRAHGSRAGADPSGTHVAAAIVAVEDERFFSHGAVDWRAIARAGVESVLHPGRDPGGSTLAQQLAKNLY